MSQKFDASKVTEVLKNAASKTGSALKTAAEKAAPVVKSAAVKTASAVKVAAEKTAPVVKDAAVKTGSAVKAGASKIKPAAQSSCAFVKNELERTPDRSMEFEPRDVQDSKIMSMISYGSILCLVPLIYQLASPKKSKYLTFHVNQGLILMLIELFTGIFINYLCGMPLIGWLFTIAKILIYLCCAALSALNIASVLAGRAKELPYVGKIKLIK